MNPLPYLPALAAALAAAACGVLFALSFTAWLICEPAARRGVYRPRPWLATTAKRLAGRLTAYAICMGVAMPEGHVLHTLADKSTPFPS